MITPDAGSSQPRPDSDAKPPEPSAPDLRPWVWGVLLIVPAMAAAAIQPAAEEMAGVHTGLEVVATILAMVVGTIAMLRYYSSREPRWLLLGLAFWGTALLDGYHAFVTSTYFAPLIPSSLSSVVPWSWSASRLFLATFLLIDTSRRLAPTTRTRLLSDVWLTALVVGFTIFSFVTFTIVPLPPAHYPQLFTPRPQELLPAALFAIALVVATRQSRRHGARLDSWILLSLLLNLEAQLLFMPFSGEIFDFPFVAAHVLKIMAYAAALVGCLSAFSAQTSIEDQLTSDPSIQETTRTLTLRFAVATAAIVLLSTVALWFTGARLRRSEVVTSRVDEAGRLRMLSSRAGLFCYRLRDDAEAADRTRRELGRIATELRWTTETVFAVLRQEFPTFDRSMLFRVESRLLEISSRTHSLARGSGPFVDSDRAAASFLIQHAESATLISDLNRLVALLQREATETLRRHELGTAALSLATLLLITMTAVFVFWPTIRRIRRTMIAHADLARRDLERFFEVSSDLIAIVDLGGRCLRINPAATQLLGYPNAKFLSQPFVEFVHPDDRAATLDLIESVLDGRPAERFENRVLRADGQVRWMSWNILAEVEEGVLYCTARDVTLDREIAMDLADYATQLEATNQDLSEFAYAASHDLKSPLRDVQNLVAWIGEDLGESLPESSQEHLELVQKRVSRLTGLLDDLLHYSQAGRAEATLESVSVVPFIEELHDLVDPTRRATLHIQCPFETIETSRVPLQQVLRNLIANAIKHNDKPQPRIDVEVFSAGNDLVGFSVRDNGPGIPEQHHERVFQLFQTLRPRDEVDGSGMGLALVRKLVESHGASIELRSTEGRGTEFRFFWPRGSVGPDHERPASSQPEEELTT